ncbi:MAG: right-handed parallel beta-helix repeat-containing protein, partial [Planctomycetota bacterium]
MGCLRRIGMVAIAVSAVAFSAVQANDVVLTVQPDRPEAFAEAVAQAKRLVAEDDQGGTVRIELAEGTHRPSGAIDIDFPKPGSPWRLEIVAAASRKAHVSGGTAVTGWQRVTDEATLARLPEEARGKVWRADLAKLGLTDFGKPSGGGVEFFFDDRPQTLARWPNEGFVKIVDVVGEQPFDVRGRKGDRVGKFVYEGDRPARWTQEKDPWVHGYWFHDWSSDHHPIARIDTDKHIIEVAPPYHHYGYRKGQWYYAYNLLCELDRPGEWYLDRETGELYFYPPEAYQDDPAKGRPVVSVLDSLLSIHDAEHVAVRGLVFEHCRATAVSIRNCRHTFLDDCVVRNAGSWGVQVNEGELCGVFDSDLYLLGDGGVRLSGGDRKTLTPGSHAAIGNDIHDYGRIHPMYKPGVAAGGVGILVAFNHIHHAPHQAIGFGGNEHTFVGNEIDHVCQESNDAGAVYSGRDWTQRGTIVVANYFHDINGFENRGCVGVYLDDMFCGTTIVGNLFRNVTRAAFVGGGRDNRVLNNVFIDCDRAVHVDARALGWAAFHLDDTMPNRLKAVPVESIAWTSRYGNLANILNDEPGAPKGNVIARNIAIGGRWSEFEKKAEPYFV